MAFCEKCGSQVGAGNTFCESCGSKVSSIYSGAGYSSAGLGDSFVQLSENEVRIRTYHSTTLKRPKGEGYLTVTNKRVVFHGTGSSFGGKSKLISEVAIETICGISAYFGRGFRIPLLILSIISGLVTLGVFGEALDDGDGEVFVAALVGVFFTALFFYLARQVTYNFSIFSSGASGTPINFGNGIFGSRYSLTGSGAAMTVFAEPTGETEKLMHELGAIIMDFKTMGDHAIKKWAPNAAVNVQNQNVNKTTGTSVSAAKSDEELFA